MASAPRFLTDEKGNRVAVVLDIAEYERLLEELEDQDALRELDEALSSGETPIPYVPLSERAKRQGK